jgi:hypothetical protein
MSVPLEFMWQHGIDERQNRAVREAQEHWFLMTGRKLDKHSMVKVILSQYLEEVRAMKPGEMTGVEQRIGAEAREKIGFAPDVYKVGGRVSDRVWLS